MKRLVSICLASIMVLSLFACNPKINSDGTVNVEKIEANYIKEVVGENAGKTHRGFVVGNVYTLEQILQAREKDMELDISFDEKDNSKEGYFTSLKDKDGYSVVINKYTSQDKIDYIKSKVKKAAFYKYSEDYPTQIRFYVVE